MLVAVLAAGLTLTARAVPAADIGSAEDCQRAIDTDASTAREAAAVWARSGGGVPARLCEAAAPGELLAQGVDDAVPEIDLGEGYLVATPPEGLLEL